MAGPTFAAIQLQARMNFVFVDEHRGHWPVQLICSVLGVSVSGYYAWRSRPESIRSVENRALLSTIRRVHADSGGSYGAPRVHAALCAAGLPACRSEAPKVGLVMPDLRRHAAADRVHGVGRHRIARLMSRSAGAKLRRPGMAGLTFAAMRLQAGDAPIWAARPGGDPTEDTHDQQPSRPPDRAEQAPA